MRLWDVGQCSEFMEHLLTIDIWEKQGNEGQEKVQGQQCSHLNSVAKMVQVARCNKTIATIVSWPSNDKDALM